MEILLRLTIIGNIFFVLFLLYVVVKAFEDSVGQALLCIFVPLYVLYYAAVRMESKKRGLVVGALIVSGLTGPILQFLGPSLIKHDACQLATNAEVGAALGEPIEGNAEAEHLTPFGTIDACTYQTVKVPQKSVVVALERKCASLDEVRKAAAAQLIPVVGVGDEAYFGGSEMTARKGNSCIYIEVRDESFPRGLSGMDKLNVAKSVGEKVFDRLP